MNSLLSLLPIWTLASCSSAHPLKAWYHPSWSNGLIAHYSGGVDLMSGISYLLDLVDLPWGGVINPGLTLNMSRPVSLRNVWSRQGPVRYTHTHMHARAHVQTATHHCFQTALDIQETNAGQVSRSPSQTQKECLEMATGNLHPQPPAAEPKAWTSPVVNCQSTIVHHVGVFHVSPKHESPMIH